MNENGSSGRDRPSGRLGRLRTGDRVGFLLRGEEQILQSITAGVPLPELLNRICSALDCEIGNVVSLVSLIDDDPATAATMAGNARHFGLYSFCSSGVISANHNLLGTLEMYSCDPWRPTCLELDLIERATCLAAIAIERGNGALEDENVLLADMRMIRKRVQDSPGTLN